MTGPPDSTDRSNTADGGAAGNGTDGAGDAAGSGSSGNGADLLLSIEGVRAEPTDDPTRLELEIATTRGSITAHLHPSEGSTGCAIFVGGAAGGVQGPAGGVYERLAVDLIDRGVTTLRVEYRNSGEFTECVMDTLAACSVLRGLGGEVCVLIGHSFGGAVVIKAGELSPMTRAVASLSAQRFGTAEVASLGKPLLLIHGADDSVLLPEASRDIYRRAAEPKRLVILEGTGHALRGVEDEVYRLLLGYITDNLPE